MVLTEKNLTFLDDAQRRQVLMQWEQQQHEDFQVDFKITPHGEVLEKFLVKKGVWNPTIVSSRHFAAYLLYHNYLFRDKTALDVGCGTGLLGIVMAQYGAGRVIMTDTSPVAVENAQENIQLYGLEKVASVVQGDLFGDLSEKVDCITFNQPFFPGTPAEGDTISASMLAPPELIRTFLREVPKYLTKGGVIVMPFFDLAGNMNNPAVVGREYNYEVKTPFVVDSTTSLQRGRIAVHELRPQ